MSARTPQKGKFVPIQNLFNMCCDNSPRARHIDLQAKIRNIITIIEALQNCEPKDVEKKQLLTILEKAPPIISKLHVATRHEFLKQIANGLEDWENLISDPMHLKNLHPQQCINILWNFKRLNFIPTENLLIALTEQLNQAGNTLSNEDFAKAMKSYAHFASNSPALEKTLLEFAKNTIEKKTEWAGKYKICLLRSMAIIHSISGNDDWPPLAKILAGSVTEAELKENSAKRSFKQSCLWFDLPYARNITFPTEDKTKSSQEENIHQGFNNWCTVIKTAEEIEKTISHGTDIIVKMQNDRIFLIEYDGNGHDNNQNNKEGILTRKINGRTHFQTALMMKICLATLPLATIVRIPNTANRARTNNNISNTDFTQYILSAVINRLNILSILNPKSAQQVHALEIDYTPDQNVSVYPIPIAGLPTPPTKE